MLEAKKCFLTPISKSRKLKEEREPTWHSYAPSKKQTGFDLGFSDSQVQELIQILSTAGFRSLSKLSNLPALRVPYAVFIAGLFWRSETMHKKHYHSV